MSAINKTSLILYSVKFRQGKLWGEFGEMNVLHQYFTQPYCRFSKEAIRQTLKLLQICQRFPYQNCQKIDLPKFYPARILFYMVAMWVLFMVVYISLNCIFYHIHSSILHLSNICDLICQNPPLTHTMSMSSFHRQWTAP